MSTIPHSKEKCEVRNNRGSASSVTTTTAPGPDDAVMEFVESGSSEDSMTTSCNSKRGRSRQESDRGPQRRAAKLKRAQKHYESLGKEWVDLRKRNAETATNLQGSDASTVHSQIVQNAKAQELPEGSERNMLVEDALCKQIPTDMSKWVKMDEQGVPRCLICKKVATEGHLLSMDHVRRMEEHAIGDLMGGEALTTRRFNSELCTGVLTKRLMYQLGRCFGKFDSSCTRETH